MRGHSKKKDNSFDLIFGIGFRTGVVVAVVSCFFIYMLFIQSTVNKMLNYVGFSVAFQDIPSSVQYIIAAATLAGVAIGLSIFEHNLRDFIRLLFYDDEH